jgi:hypothetical protein
MKKTQVETKKLSISAVTVRKLESELTPEQLKLANGAADPPESRGCGSVRAVC